MIINYVDFYILIGIIIINILICAYERRIVYAEIKK